MGSQNFPKLHGKFGLHGKLQKKEKRKKKTTLGVMLYIFPSREKHTAVNVSANLQTVSREKRGKKSLQRLARLQLFFSIF